VSFIFAEFFEKVKQAFKGPAFLLHAEKPMIAKIDKPKKNPFMRILFVFKI
jgi:hypothetical protein